MDYSNFDRILEYLCSGIMSKGERERVRDELYDHLMTKYEINLAVGMSEEEATESAVNDLGDKAKLRDNFSKVHSYYPAICMKSALKLVIAGFLLMSIHINFIVSLQDITTLIGEFVFAVGLFCFRKTNSSLKISFASAIGETFFSLLSYAMKPYAGEMSETAVYFTMIFSALQCILYLSCWFNLFKGLRELTEPYLHLKTKPLRFGLCTALVCLPSIISKAAEIFVLYEQMTLNFELPDVAAIMLFAYVIVSIVMTLQLFLGINKLLLDADHEYIVEDSATKKVAFLAVLLAVNIMFWVGSDAVNLMKKAEITPYSIENYEISDEDYNSICAELSGYGIPRELINKLPKSEIAMYRGIVPAEEVWAKEVLYSDVLGSSEQYGSMGFKIKAESYAVKVRNGESEEIRVLNRYKYQTENNTPFYFVDGISRLSQYTDLAPVTNWMDFEDWEFNNDLLLLLSEENGVLYENKPFKIYNYADLKISPHMGIAGAEFEAKPNLEIIFASSYYKAVNYDISDDYYAGDRYFSAYDTVYDGADVKSFKIIHRVHPFSFETRTAKELMDFGETTHRYGKTEYDEFILMNKIVWAEDDFYDENINSPNEVETSDIYAYDNLSELITSEFYVNE